MRFPACSHRPSMCPRRFSSRCVSGSSTAQSAMASAALACCCAQTGGGTGSPPASSLSTVAHMWIWEHGGGYFGVPLANFLGWYLTVYMFLQLFALYHARRALLRIVSLPRDYWYQPCVMFVVMALDYPAAYFGAENVAVTDATGRVWQTGDIYETAAIVSLCTMLFVAGASFAVVLLREPQIDVPKPGQK